MSAAVRLATLIRSKVDPPRVGKAALGVAMCCVMLAVATTGRVGAAHVERGRARTYHVSPNGRDDNAGDALLPFRTIQRAVDIAAPGEIVLVADGVYTGLGDGTPCASSSRPVVCISHGGTKAERIVIRAEHKWGARIDGRSNSSSEGFRFVADAGYVTIDGFEISDVGNPAKSASGIELFTGGHDVIITRNHIHRIGRVCTDTSNGQVGVFLQQPRITITGNVIEDIGRFSPNENNCAPKNGYYQNHDHGIYVNGRTSPGASDVTITNNVFSNNRHGWGIQVYPGAVANLSILNNTFISENPYSVGHILIGAATTNSRIVNNLFVDPLSAAINFYAGAHTNLKVFNNLSSRALANRLPDGVTLLDNVENVDPQVNGSDFRPTALSPAIDGGRSLAEVSIDIDAVTRPQGRGWDLGAVEARRSKR